MTRSEPGLRLPLALGAGLLACLVALAGLQYRWIAQLSEAERVRLQASLESGVASFCDRFDRELTRASRGFQPPDGIADAGLQADLASRLARWRSSALEPGLVKELLVVTRIGGGDVELQRLDETAGRLVPATWSAELDSVLRIFRARGKVPLLDEELPGLVLPVRLPPPPPREGEPPEPAERRPPREHVIVRLDRAFLVDDLLPRLARQELGGNGGIAYSVTVLVAASPGTVVFRGGPGLDAERAGGRPDASRELFALRFFPELANPPGTNAPPRREGRPADPPEGRGRAGDGAPEAGRWLLEARHPSGSLEAAVSGARRRNLGISLAVLALLATAVALLVVSTRRAQRLARQQMDFVAAVSHELKTPLTAIRSAGQNLADGIVDEPEKVRKYGALVEREGRRLTEMVGRVLAFSGIRSGSQSFHMRPVTVRALVEGVLQDARPGLEERRVEVETDLPTGLPDVWGDEPALRQALSNLVDNAVKYGGRGRWVAVRARVASGPRGDEVVLSVSDRGIGVSRSDLHRVFDPFFRSAEASSAGIAGSGLGLAVVRGIAEAHGGRCTAESVPGAGSTFSLHLPVARGAAGKGESA